MAGPMLSIDIQHRNAQGLKRFIAAQPAIGNLIANAISEELSEFVQDRYLSGQVLGVRRGITLESTRFFKLKTGVFGVRPGSGIRGRLNYLLSFERGSRPFMQPAAEAFEASGAPLKIGLRIQNAMQRKVLKGG